MAAMRRDPESLTLPQAAELLRLTPDTLRQQIHKGRLQATKLGRDWLVTRDELDRYTEEHLGKRGRRPKA